MGDHDGITDNVRSREDEYFRRKDRELVERMRQSAAANATRQDLEARSGIHDPEMVQELEALGFTPETVSLLPLVPIVQIAWAEGGVSDDERRLIVQLARQRGIMPGSAGDRQLSAWLGQKPSDEVFARALRLVRAMFENPEVESGGLRLEDLIHHCEEIAAVSGGVLGFRKISAEERALMKQVEQALKKR